MYLWGLLLAGGMTENEITSLFYQSTFTWIFSYILCRALSCLRLSGHNFLVQRMRHNRNRRPYGLRICDKCDRHSVQVEKHILLDCPHEHLVSFRTQHRQLVFPLQNEDGPTRLRTFLNHPDMNHPDIYGVASFVAECLALFP